MNKLFLALCFLGFSIVSYTQQKEEFIYKDTTGKILTKTQVDEIMKTGFSMKKGEIENGKRVITLIPVTKEDIEKWEKEKEELIASFIGKPLMPFNFVDTKGNTYTKESLKGKVIVLNFWFIACNPCQREMPQLNKLVEEFKDKEVVFLGLATDKKEKLQEFLQKKAFAYHIIPDDTNYTDSLKIESFPTHFIVDQTGIIRYALSGYEEDIEKKLAATINILLNK